MDDLPFLVVLIRRLRAVVVWIVAAIFAVLLYIDFTEDEYKAAKNLNFLSVSLGKNILRVETAALSALSFIKLIEDQ